MIDSKLANDRTFLAWLRTGISLFGFGFVIAKISLVVEPGNQGVSDKVLYTGIGVVMVLSGAALVAFGYTQHASLAHTLEPDDQAPARWPRTIATGAAVGSLLLSILIIITT
jgi:putative membrane protein